MRLEEAKIVVITPLWRDFQRRIDRKETREIGKLLFCRSISYNNPTPNFFLEKQITVSCRTYLKSKIMQDNKIENYIKEVLKNMPSDWLGLTTHRLDIYNEEKAKTEFLAQFEVLFQNNNSEKSALSELPTAYDYIRLGHPLSCILEWAIANLNKLNPENVISFSSQMTPVLAVLRTNLLENKNTQILYNGKLPDFFNVEIIENVYGYKFKLSRLER